VDDENDSPMAAPNLDAMYFPNRSIFDMPRLVNDDLRAGSSPEPNPIGNGPSATTRP
jgi:hypothetical protein